MAKVMEILRKDHRNMRRLLDILEGQLELIRAENIPDGELLDEVVNYCLTYPDLYHHPKEDLIFQLLQQVAPEEAAEIEDLTAEHLVMAGAARDTGRLIEQAAEGDTAAEESLPQKVGAYLRFYRTHMAREEKDFFPLALRVLTPKQWLTLETQVIDPTDPLFAERASARLNELLGDESAATQK